MLPSCVITGIHFHTHCFCLLPPRRSSPREHMFHCHQCSIFVYAQPSHRPPHTFSNHFNSEREASSFSKWILPSSYNGLAPSRPPSFSSCKESLLRMSVSQPSYPVHNCLTPAVMFTSKARYSPTHTMQAGRPLIHTN